MKEPRLPTGSSDPISYTCTCSVSTTSHPNQPDGLILLFYRYFASPPSLPPTHALAPSSIAELAAFHTHLTSTLHLGGKIRVGNEGFNITVGGTASSIQAYISALLTHWSLAGLDLETEEKRDAFFKPSPGCACCFGGEASVRITNEITPMGVTNYVPRNWDSITYLSPEEFHEKLNGGEEVLLVDVRNHYESRIGYFVDPKTGEAGLRPAVRRFAQWPLYVRKRFAREASLSSDAEPSQEEEPRKEQEKAVLTYCTGGIRCEKGARFLSDSLATTTQSPQTKVYTLHGGISAYLAWFDAEILAGRKTASESLFKGKNYVFDARGSVGLTNTDGRAQQEPVACCHVCDVPSDRLSKCQSKGCHLVLVACASCEESDRSINCCESCKRIDNDVVVSGDGNEKPQHRPMCACEKERELLLWGPEAFSTKTKAQKSQAKNVKGKGKGIKSAFGGVDGIDIRVKTIG